MTFYEINTCYDLLKRKTNTRFKCGWQSIQHHNTPIHPLQTEMLVSHVHLLTFKFSYIREVKWIDWKHSWIFYISFHLVTSTNIAQYELLAQQYLPQDTEDAHEPGPSEAEETNDIWKAEVNEAASDYLYSEEWIMKTTMYQLSCLSSISLINNCTERSLR